MNSKYLLLLIINLFVFSSFSFCQGTIKTSDSTEDATSISFLYGNYILFKNRNDVYPIFGLSLNAPIGKKFFLVPEFFLISSENPKGFWRFHSLLIRYKLININILDLYIQSGLALVFPHEVFFLQYQLGLNTEINIINDIKIGFDYRYLPIIMNENGYSNSYSISIGINF